MLLSVVVCTYNRSKQLERALASLIDQTLALQDYEIIVVNNASTDGTRDVAVKLAQAAPNLRYVYEPELGLSNARNSGVREARGEIVAFMDDDAAADKAWLAHVAEVFRRGDTRLGCVGGKVLPVWPRSRPAWLSEPMLGFLGLLDYGDESRPCDFPKEYAIGCNMAFRREFLLSDGQPFDPQLGRRGSNLVGNEEIALQSKVSKQGGIIYYEAKSLVHHFVPEERLTRRWFIRRTFDQGVSDVLAGHDERRRSSLPKLTGDLARSLLVLARSLVRLNEQEMFLRTTRVSEALGALSQATREHFPRLND